MKLRGNPPATNNPDTGWKIGVERHSPSQRGQPFRGNINMSGLAKSMNSRVSSTSAMHSDRLLEDLRQRRFNMVLDAFPVRLALPACESSTVIRNCQVESFEPGREASLHQIFRTADSK
jgi:hypothetical protein